MQEIITNTFKSKKVRTIYIDSEIWFVAKDVLEILLDNINPNVGQAIKDLEEDERSSFKMTTSGGIQDMVIISESGLYSLIMRSRKAVAKPFQRWVTRKVLPSIRKTGSYSISETKNFSEILSVNKEALKVVGLFKSSSSFDLLLLQKLLKEKSISSLFQLDFSQTYFLPTEIGKLHGLSPVETNLELQKRGFQEKENGIWKLTESGKKFGMEFSGKFSQLKWKLKTPL
jgi:prophage antirepressor-like protein